MWADLPVSESVVTELYWHCDRCGDHDLADPGLPLNTTEACVCAGGVCRVMTLEEAASLEQSVALRANTPLFAPLTKLFVCPWNNCGKIQSNRLLVGFGPLADAYAVCDWCDQTFGFAANDPDPTPYPVKM